MGALFVGVDGGGTGTRCVVAGEKGDIIGRGRAGGANPVSVADPAANLLAALLAALDGLDRSRVAGGVFGMAGSGVTGEFAERAWKEAGLPGQPIVVPDMLVAFTSATTEPDGTVLVSGTGAVGARIRGRRVVRRADGHGWLLGDEGSGVWIGRRAVTAALTALDGRTGPTVLVDAVAATVLEGRRRPVTREDASGAELAQAIVSAVYHHIAESGPAWLGRLAPLTDAAARDGDPVALEIVREAAALLCRTARAVSATAGKEAPDADDAESRARDGGPLVLAGSLLTEATELSRRVRAELRAAGGPSPRRVLLAGDGAAGAAALALRAVLPEQHALEGHRGLIGQRVR